MKKFKEFNLKAALAGAPVVTREGKELLAIVSNQDTRTRYGDLIYLIVVGERVVSRDAWSDGRYYKGAMESKIDLFMAPEKKSGWVNVYRTDGEYILGEIHETKKKALEVAITSTVDTITINWEG